MSIYRTQGDRVVIYHDPETEQHIEGVATLETYLGGVDLLKVRSLERWSVRFTDTEALVTREVLTPKVKP